MKFACLLLIALYLTNSSYCQTWKGTGVGNPGNEIFYNADDISKVDIGGHKHVLKAWFKEKYAKHKVDGVLYNKGYTLTSYAFDCQENLWSLNERIFYDSSDKAIQDYPYGIEW